MNHLLWIRTDNVIVPVPREDVTLAKMKSMIGQDNDHGAYLQLVQVHSPFTDAQYVHQRVPVFQLWLDEEGKNKRLPYNATATLLYRYEPIAGHALLAPLDFDTE